jgi:type II secretory pathway component PulM
MSIGAGVLSLGGLTTLAEAQEMNDWLSAAPPTAVMPEFEKLDKSWAQRTARWQQVLFVLGRLVCISVGIADRFWSPSSFSVQVKAIPPAKLDQNAQETKYEQWFLLQPFSSGQI